MACRPLPAAPSAAPSPASDRQAILALMAAEADAAVHDDAARLLALWTADGVIRDARHTADDPDDDNTWIGHDAILSYYSTVVFPLHLNRLERRDIDLSIQGDTATAAATTVIESETSPGGERWTFARTPSGWRIASITYNLESP